MDSAAGGGRVAVGRSATLSLARPGPRLWRLLSATGAAHGNRGGRDLPAESVAESLRGAPHREYPPRMPGSRDRPARATPAAAPDRILSLLSSLAHAPGIGHGLSGAAAGPTAGGWLDQRSPRGGWAASSRRATSGVIAWVLLCRIP